MKPCVFKNCRYRQYLVLRGVIQFDFMEESPRKWHTAVPIHNLVHYLWSTSATLVFLSAQCRTGWAAACGDNLSWFSSPTGWRLHTGGSWTELFWCCLVHVMRFRMDFKLHIRTWIGRSGSSRVGLNTSSLMLERIIVLILKDIKGLSDKYIFFMIVKHTVKRMSRPKSIW